MNNSLRLTVITLLLAVSNLPAATLYVSLGSTNPAPPYASWAAAATTIQQAVGAAAAGDDVVVTNGVYTGGVAVTKPLTLRSVNGPQVTIIDYGVTLTNGASLSGFTLTNGYCYRGYGGGVWCASTNAFLTNCVISGNSAYTDVGYGGEGGGVYQGTLYECTLSGNSATTLGGGAYGSTLYHCTLTGNSAGSGGGASFCTLYDCTLSGNSAFTGGGAYLSTLYNCTLSSNSAHGEYANGGGVEACTLYNCSLSSNWSTYGGGASGCTLYNCTLTGNLAVSYGGGDVISSNYNCIVYFNTAPEAANCDSESTLNYCCTTPLPAGGTGNIALDPQLASASHLSTSSPCRGAGSPAYASGVDIDGEAWANPPSIGCDEYHVGGGDRTLKRGNLGSLHEPDRGLHAWADGGD